MFFRFLAMLLLPAVVWAEGDASQPLEHIVVTATGSERSTLLAPASLSVISGDELRAASDPDLVSGLRNTPGVTLAGRGVGGRKVIQLRGMSSHHSLILIDGKRVSATDDVIGHSDFQYEWLPMNNIERVEVIRGPMSSLYGSEALGGVVNIITRRGKPSNNLSLGGSLLREGDGGEQHNANVQLATEVNDALTLSANLGYRRQQAVPDDSDSRLSKLEGREVKSAQLAAEWQVLEDHVLEFDYLYSEEERWRHTNSRGGPPFFKSWYDLDREQWSVYWRPQWGAWRGHLGYYRSEVDVVNDNDHSQVDPSTAQFLKDDVVEARVYRDFNIARLTFGAEWRDEKLEHPSFVGGSDSVEHMSFLAQYETELVADIHLTLGSRWDDHDFFGSEISPRAYLVWEFMPNLAFKAGYGHGFKAPTLKQISPDYRFDGPHSFVGNPGLDPETSDSWELGVRYEGRSMEASAMWFHNDVDSLISTACIARCDQRFGRLNEYVKIDKVKLQGFELEVRQQLDGGFGWHVSYSYTDGEDKDTGEKLPNRPEHQGSIGIKQDWTSAFSTALDWQYIGDQTTATRSGALDLPSYTLVNARASYTWGNHRFSLKLNNLGDTNLQDKSDAFGYAEHGRRAFLDWQWQF